MQHMIEASGLRKSYGPIEAVKGISFYVERGGLFAFLGPNGAGKSTTIDILCTLLSPDGGEVRIDGLLLGKDNDAIRRRIGVVFQDNVLDRLLTVRENLLTRARFYKQDKKERAAAMEAAMDAADVREFADRRYGKLSGGQKRRADIARALVHTPQALFLDEPTTGLDPQTRRSVWNTIRAIQAQRGMTVFFSTHYMEEAAQADYIIIIDHGMIAAQGTPQQLKERYALDSVRLRARDDQALLQRLAALGQEPTPGQGGVFCIPIAGKDETLRLLNEVSSLIDDFEVIHGTMDDVFIRVTGEEVREG